MNKKYNDGLTPQERYNKKWLDQHKCPRCKEHDFLMLGTKMCEKCFNKTSNRITDMAKRHYGEILTKNRTYVMSLLSSIDKKYLIEAMGEKGITLDDFDYFVAHMEGSSTVKLHERILQGIVPTDSPEMVQDAFNKLSEANKLFYGEKFGKVAYAIKMKKTNNMYKFAPRKAEAIDGIQVDKDYSQVSDEVSDFGA